MIEQFIDRALMAGAEIEHVAGLSGAARTIKEFLEKNNLKTALISPGLKMKSPFDTEFSGIRTALPVDTLWVDAGIVAAEYGVAETGTLVHFDQNDEEKNVWTLPEVCLCLLDRRRIVADLSVLGPEFARHLGRTDIPSPQVSLVTGPSRTADIECQLTIGVHGPSRLIVLIL